jgi:hypothetical protein
MISPFLPTENLTVYYCFLLYRSLHSSVVSYPPHDPDLTCMHALLREKSIDSLSAPSSLGSQLLWEMVPTYLTTVRPIYLPTYLSTYCKTDLLRYLARSVCDTFTPPFCVKRCEGSPCVVTTRNEVIRPDKERKKGHHHHHHHHHHREGEIRELHK